MNEWNLLGIMGKSEHRRMPNVLGSKERKISHRIEENSHAEDFEGNSDDEEITFIIKRFQNLARKNKRFSSESSGFRGSGFREKKDDHKVFFNCKKPSHFIIECPGLQKDKPKKGSFHKDNFKNRFKKSLMKTWDELDNEEDTENCEEKVNLALMALTSSEAEPESDFGSKSEEEDKV
ncbi:hypothetical protein KIW84_063520 [Lathyrus oleraceus]|uniref:Uncharacterized protein n=1 Tax=Pisum sativum TaxID=3888 RepID=A0A9D5A9R4_PEA|nr:hypothetical protein KIW84_063520 [Pisum sativum]